MDKKKIITAVLALVLMNIILYAKTVKYDFVNHDDYTYIKDNTMIKELSVSNVKDMFTHFYASNYQPLVHMSYAVDHAMADGRPSAFHATNVVLHTINAILVLFLLYFISGDFWLSILTALFFSIHPVQVESVAWVSERKGLICAFFYFLSFMSYIYFSRGADKKFYFISILLIFLALLAKPMALTFPVILIIFDYYEGKLSKSTVTNKIPYFVISAIFAVITVMAQGSGGAINVEKTTHIVKNFIFAFYAFGFYIGKVIAPMNLSVTYAFSQAFEKGYGTSSAYSTSEFYVSITVIVLFVAYIVNFKKIRRDINFGLLFFFVTLLPVIRLVPIGNTFAADRYLYMPIIGFFFALISFIKPHIASKPLLKKLAVIVAALYLGILSYINSGRCAVWDNTYTLWVSVLEVTPDSFDAVSALGEHYYDTMFRLGQLNTEKKEYEKAREYYSLTLKYDQMREAAKRHDGITLERFDRQFPREKYVKVREQALYAIGITYFYENDLNNAEKFFSVLTAEYPGSAKGYMQLANISDIRGESDKAAFMYEKSLQIAPEDAAVHYNYAVSIEKSGDIKSAIEHYRLADKFSGGWDMPKKAIKRLSGHVKNANKNR